MSINTTSTDTEKTQTSAQFLYEHVRKNFKTPTDLLVDWLLEAILTYSNSH